MKNEMNDEFLHRLRKEPSAKYLAALKASLDRQAIRQAKTRGTLFRTAILAALIGGSAVAVAFVAWHGAPGSFGTVAQLHEPAGERPVPAKNLISSPEGGGAAKSGIAAPGAAVAAGADPSQAVIGFAGVAEVVMNAQSLARFPLDRGLLKKADFTQTSTTQGIGLLCHTRRGADSATVDIVGADRRILAAELSACKRNGITRITELHPGYDVVVLARSKLYGAPRLSARAIFLALAAYVPDPNVPQNFIKNPYQVWNDIDSTLSGDQIEILGPALSSSAVAAFRQTLMEAGCLTFPAIAVYKDSNPDRFDKLCHSVRSDGVYRDYGKIGAMLVEQLDTYPNALALLKFKEASARQDTLITASVDGVAPSNETIVAQTYAGSRPMYVYVNSARAAAFRPLMDFILAYERSAMDPFSGSTLVALDPAQRQAEMQSAMTLPDVKL
jgi:phosphate transport system substrate-binding protein